MAVSRDILGMNARNFLYIRKYNVASAKRIADDKLETKKLLIAEKIPTTNLLHSFENREEIRKFDWNKLLENGFVIKPARGYGGGGILVIKRWEKDKGYSITGVEYSIKQLESHLFDILEGAYSLQFLPDKAFMEERILLHPFFKRIAPVGIADIRIIVFNHIPIMAMLRIPTVESGGKANLHLGALGVGIDMRTGITTYAVYKNKLVDKIPETKFKTRGIKIPQWYELLLMASQTQTAIGLGYGGVDIVFDAKKGPVVLEVNSRPGLSIQMANATSLRTRLERIEHMSPPSPERGVEVAKSLFAESFSEKVTTFPRVLTIIQNVTIRNEDNEKTVEAKLDSGAYRTSIDEKLAKELGLKLTDEKIFVKSASGEAHRPVVIITFTLAGKKITTIATLADRSKLQYQMIVGRKDLSGFLLKPVLHQEQKDTPVEKEEH